MRKYQPWAFAAALFLFIGAVSPDSNEKELIIRLQGEVIVLQRQVRDMQEFLDKWQARSSDSLTKIATEMDSTSRGVASLEESVKNSQLALRNNSTGTANQMAKLTEQVTLNTQQSAQIRKQLESLQQALSQFGATISRPPAACTASTSAAESIVPPPTSASCGAMRTMVAIACSAPGRFSGTSTMRKPASNSACATSAARSGSRPRRIATSGRSGIGVSLSMF